MATLARKDLVDSWYVLSGRAQWTCPRLPDCRLSWPLGSPCWLWSSYSLSIPDLLCPLSCPSLVLYSPIIHNHIVPHRGPLAAGESEERR